MKINCKLITDEYFEEEVDFTASNEESIKGDWWNIYIGGKKYNIQQKELESFCKAIISIIKNI